MPQLRDMRKDKRWGKCDAQPAPLWRKADDVVGEAAPAAAKDEGVGQPQHRRGQHKRRYREEQVVALLVEHILRRQLQKQAHSR